MGEDIAGYYDKSLVTPWGIKIRNRDVNNFDYNQFYKDLKVNSGIKNGALRNNNHFENY